MHTNSSRASPVVGAITTLVERWVSQDAARFNACFDSHKYSAQVDTDFRDGTEAGVNGTPAFFINGRIISGAQPFEAFKRIIDDELARTK